jgi:serine phosphatase RsbU (regulator of sigma subunit)
VFKRARQNSIDARLLMAPVILTISANLLYDGAWMARFVGWHDITRYFRLTTYPFPIKVFEVTDSMFLLSVFGILVLRFARTSSEEEHYASEFESARSVQQYLIPDHLPDTPGLRIESEYRPAREVGGDFFQIIPDSQDGSALILVGDVAGHGLKAGMLSALIVGSIRTAVSFTSDPVRMMTTLNERLQGRGLVTCLALRIESDGSASLVNAGHLPPYLNGKELAIEGSLPLGAISGIDFPVLNFSLAEGDTLMLMTDGIAEAHNAEGDLFGFERIGEMIRTGQPASALANGAQAFGQEDDITVLTVRSVPA